MLKQIIVCTQMVPSLRHSFQLQAPSPAFLPGWGEILTLFGKIKDIDNLSLTILKDGQKQEKDYEFY